MARNRASGRHRGDPLFPQYTEAGVEAALLDADNLGYGVVFRARQVGDAR